MSHPPRDVTPLPDLLRDAALAGPMRTRRPDYADLVRPCNVGCPAGEHQAWLVSTRVGEPERAWQQLTAGNPLPASHGRVCYHLSESACNRAELDSSVPIHSVGDRRLLAAPRSAAEPRPVGRTPARADGHDGEHQR